MTALQSQMGTNRSVRLCCVIENEKIATIVKGIWDCIWVFVEESEELKIVDN